MAHSQFRKPLTQSAVLICAVVILFIFLSSTGAEGNGTGILTFLSGAGSFILLIIGLAIALPVSIAILVAIFLGAVYLQSREDAAKMYLDLKKNLSLIMPQFKNGWLCCSNDSNTSISQEEYNLMEQELKRLKKNNTVLQSRIESIKKASDTAEANLSELTQQNTALKEQLNNISQAVEELQISEKDLTQIITTLETKFDEINAGDLRKQIAALEDLNTTTNTTIESIAQRMATLEQDSKKAPVSGIFSYIENESDRTLFTDAVQEALSQELTYAKIDEFLSNTLEPELDRIIKEHPSLTKNYIRNLKRS